MILHLLKVQTRRVGRQGLFFSINLIGLSIGLASAFIILLYAYTEMTFDRYHKQHENIYRLIYTDTTSYGTSDTWDITSVLLKDHIKSNYNEVEKCARIFNIETAYINHNNDFYKESQTIRFIDDELFDIFSIKMLSGNKDIVLKNLESVVISESASRKYFAQNDPIGNELDIRINQKQYRFIVSGIFQNLPSNSTFQADIIGNIKRIENDLLAKDWETIECQTYLLIDKNMHGLFETKLNLAAPLIHQNNAISYTLQNIKDIYLYSDFSSWSSPKGNLKNLHILIGIAILLLALACINYILLSVAQSELRNKEIGIRKVVGSGKLKLAIQLLMESTIITLLAFPTAIVLIETLLPIINNYLSINITTYWFKEWKILLSFFIITIFTGILAGSYTSFYLASLQPIKVLYNRASTPTKSKNIIFNSLIFVQLIIFICILGCTLVIKSQLNLALKRDYGFNTEKTLIINCEGQNANQFYQTFKDELQKHPEISKVASANTGLFTPDQSAAIIHPIDQTDKNIIALLYNTDSEYPKAAGFQITKGRSFRSASISDSSGVLVSELLVMEMGLKNPIGQKIDLSNRKYEILGVIKDFKSTSVKHGYIPYILLLKNKREAISQILIHSSHNDLELTKTIITNTWEKHAPFQPLEIERMNDLVTGLYKEEQLSDKILSIFSILTIFIASMGLLGISAFNALRLTKEIGIRKVFGASPNEIYKMILKKNSLILILANVVSVPIIYYVMSKWLDNYTFKIQLIFWHFFIPFLLSFIILLSIMILKSIKVVRSNPVNSLKCE